MKVPSSLAAVFVFLAGTAQAGPILWVNDDAGRIGKVDVATGAVTVVGSSGVELTDIAFDPGGNLYGVGFRGFYSIDQATGAATLVGALNTGDSNALVFSSSGVAYTMGYASDNLYTIDVATGVATSIGGVGGFASGGDLAFHDGRLYLASRSNQLVEVQLGVVGGVAIGPFSVANVYGLANGDDDVLYAVAGTSVYSVDVVTGAATFVVDYGGQGLGDTNGEAFFLEAVATVPEPSGLLLLALGSPAFWLRRRSQG